MAGLRVGEVSQDGHDPEREWTWGYLDPGRLVRISRLSGSLDGENPLARSTCSGTCYMSLVP